MRMLWKDILSAILLGMILPALLLNAAVLFLNLRRPMVEIEASTPPVETESGYHPVRVKNGAGVVTEEDMDEYLVKVLLGEVPASFAPEALKAQSVAARTYAQKANISGGKHGDGSVCTRASCCQGYVTQEEYLALGGTQEGIDRIKQAVDATSGQCLTYEGELIEATYFSCSGGFTEDAAAVWGAEYPYLQAVSSPGEENAAYHTETRHFTARAFQNALGQPMEGTPSTWFGQITYTEGGGVKTMDIGGEIYTGTQLRTLLNLRSTAFTIESDGEIITITTRGYGHRVGMSQYGADAMAVGGSSYQEILTYYYPGTELFMLDSSIPQITSSP